MDSIAETYGEEVANAMRGAMPDLVCECCCELDRDKLRRVPLLMGGTALAAPLGPNDRFICEACFLIWYEYGLTCSDEIGKKYRELKAAGKYPFKK